VFRGRESPWIVLPLAMSAAVYHPITRNYFYGDDFLNLYRIVNFPALEYLLTPHGGHVLLARNAWFWACFQAFGTEPSGYLWTALLTHLVNVSLLFVVASRLAGSPRIGCFGAALWGVAPMHEGTLGWYSVYGHAVAATTMLVILLGVTRLRAENLPPSRGTLWLWYALALVGATSFGVGIGIAMTLPFVLALLLPRPSKRPWPPLLSLLLVVPALYVGMHWLYTALSGEVLLTGRTLEAYLAHWEAVLPMLARLFLHGVSGLSLGFLHEPEWTAGWLSFAVAGLWTFGLLHVLRRAAQDEKREFLALLLLASGSYGMIALGRASVLATLNPLGIGAGIAADAPRYHYTASVPLALILCRLLARIRLPGPRGERASLVVLVAGLFLMIGAWFVTPPWIDHHDASREETNGVLAAVRSRIRAAEPGGEIHMLNRRFHDVGLIVQTTMFPGWAAVFTIFFPENMVDGKRVYFVEPNSEVIEAAKRGRRISRVLLLVAKPPQPEERRREPNWFERKLDSLHRR
jgi:hypothetical protein